MIAKEISNDDKRDEEMKITTSKENIFLSVILLFAALQCFLGEYSAAPIRGGGELPPLQKWQFIVGGIAFLCMSVGLLFKK
jgi:hypothetical protein